MPLTRAINPSSRLNFEPSTRPEPEVAETFVPYPYCSCDWLQSHVDFGGQASYGASRTRAHVMQEYPPAVWQLICAIFSVIVLLRWFLLPPGLRITLSDGMMELFKGCHTMVLPRLFLRSHSLATIRFFAAEISHRIADYNVRLPSSFHEDLGHWLPVFKAQNGPPFYTWVPHWFYNPNVKFPTK